MASRTNFHRDRSTFTLTFGDQAENHVGMEQLGTMVVKGQGFQPEELAKIEARFAKSGFETEYYDLGEDAHLLILKGGIEALLAEDESVSIFTSEDVFNEQAALEVDKQAYMYGRVVQKHARWNLCFDDVGHDPDYEHGKGRVIPWGEIPITALLHRAIPKVFGKKAENLKCEANYYYDIEKCGIGFHGDSERRKVIGVRLGASLPLHFQWYLQGDPIGERMIFNLDDGDVYIMSEKTVGTDWRMKTIKTLRHAAGCKKYTQ